MRILLTVVCVTLAYYALRAVIRWLLQTPAKPERRSVGGSADAEMVLDPECGVYILKERAVSRRVRGTVLYFCGEQCVSAHEARSGG